MLQLKKIIISNINPFNLLLTNINVSDSMKKSYKVSLLLFFLLFITAQFSMAQLGFSGELRVRPEYRRGYKSLALPDQDPAFFISQRTRLKLHYEEERFSFHIALQDVRTWGNTSQLNISDAYFSLHEAWGGVQISKQFNLKVGRQELVYDDHRILGSVNWAQQGRSHDLVLLKFEKNSFKWHTGLAYNQDKQQLSTNYYSVEKNYKTMQFIWLHSEFEKTRGSILFLNNGMQNADTTMSFSQTLGTYLNFDLGNLKLNLAGYYQMGKDALKKDLSAGYVNVDVSWPLSFGLIPTIGVEYLSGTDQSNDLTNNSFAPLYGTNHKFNGHMDYFYVGNHINNVGLTNPYLRLVYKLDKWILAGTIHYFSSSGEILDPSDPALTLKNYLGTEVDLSISRKIFKYLSVSAGYSQMFATNSMEAIKGGDSSTTNNWAWLMLAFTPDFLKSNKKQ